MASDGVGWRRMASDGIRWRRMASDGVGWRRMATDGVGWRRMASDGVGWRRMASGCCRRSLSGDLRWVGRYALDLVSVRVVDVERALVLEHGMDPRPDLDTGRDQAVS